MTRFPPLYILRHGETEWNATGRLQGHHDSQLTETGRTQAAAQRVILGDENLRGFCAISSPQGRAVQTAEIALDGLGTSLQVDDALREIGLGEWAGLDRAELMAQSSAVDGFDLYELAPKGEGFQQLRQRCEEFLHTLDQPAVLITHGITSRMLRLILTEKPTTALREMPGGQGVVFHVQGGVQKRLQKGA